MKEVPRIRFAQLPTPIEPMQNLSRELGMGRFFVKRDDQTGLAFGGNKIRKLEFLIAEAQAQNAKTVITTGAVQSNHCRQTVATAAHFGLKCILILTGLSPKKISGNLLLDKLLGAEIVWSSREQREADLQKTFEIASGDGRRPFLIPYGGSNHTGILGYVFAMKEMVDQGHNPSWIIFPTSSGGTQAGMILGAKLFGYQGKILGISVDEKREPLVERIQKLIADTAEYLQIDVTVNKEDILVNDEYIGAGYGVMGRQEIEAIHLLAKTEGLLVDPVYTGKAAAGMISLTRAGYFVHDDEIIFWHTGGTPTLFADIYSDDLINTF
jgi:D-cysteine desulfhydrase family pyridoxal phosphate-dependent enzyme